MTIKPGQDTRLARPVRYGFCRTLRENFHWKCLITTLLVHFCVFYAIWCHTKYLSFGRAFVLIGAGPCSHGYNFIPVALGILLYLVYLSECWHYHTITNCIPRREVNQVRGYIEAMRAAIPIVWWKSVCYHYLRRTRQITRYRNGDAITATQVYYERVNSHTSGNVFLFEQCGFRDLSKELADLDRYSVVNMRISKGFVFACIQAANEFEEQRARFFTENEQRDDYMEVREGLDLADLPFIERIMVFPNHRRQSLADAEESASLDFAEHSETILMPWFMRSTIFWVTSAFLLSWPLRMFRELQCAHVHVQITKLFGTNYLSPSSVNYTGPLSRSATMESHELEMANRQNYLIVPSYSQAILLKPQTSYEQPSTFLRNLFRTRNDPVPPFGGPSSYRDYGYGALLENGPSPNDDRWAAQPAAPLNPLQNYRNHNSERYKDGRSYVNGYGHQNAIIYPTTVIPTIAPPPRSRSLVSFPNARSFALRPSTLLVPLPAAPESSSRWPLPRRSNFAASQHQDQRFSSSSARPLRSHTIAEGISQFAATATNANGGSRVNWCAAATTERTPLLLNGANEERHHHQHRHHEQHWHRHTVDTVEPPPNEPPPPYELAMRVCVPLYQRLRQSLDSISMAFNSLGPNSRSNSRNFTQMQSVDENDNEQSQT